MLGVYLPEGQLSHALWPVWSLYIPAAQLVHDNAPGPENVPAGQAVHDVSSEQPAPLCRPAGQSAQALQPLTLVLPVQGQGA